MLRFSSCLISQHVVKQSYPNLRNLSFIRHLRPRSVLLDKSKHQIIYEFQYIVPMSYFIRTKFWVPLLMTAITPIGMLNEEIRFTVLGGFIASWLHSGVVHLMSKFAANTIGKIYVNKENEAEDVIISSMDGHGNRIDRLHKPRDIIVYDYATRVSHSMGFVTIHIDNTDLMYMLNVINHKVHNQKSFYSLFKRNCAEGGNLQLCEELFVALNNK